MAIFFNLPPTSNHLHPLQIVNCDRNSRLVVDEDDNDKFGLERVKIRSNSLVLICVYFQLQKYVLFYIVEKRHCGKRRNNSVILI